MNWLAARAAARNGVVDSRAYAAASPSTVEALEDRCLLAVNPPQVLWAVADNRGQVVLKLDEKLNANTVSRKSVKMSMATSGADAAITNYSVKYIAKAKTIT